MHDYRLKRKYILLKFVYVLWLYVSYVQFQVLILAGSSIHIGLMLLLNVQYLYVDIRFWV